MGCCCCCRRYQAGPERRTRLLAPCNPPASFAAGPGTEPPLRLPPLSGEKGRIAAASPKAIVKVSAPGRSPGSSPQWSGGGIGEQFAFPAMPRQGTGMQEERSSPVEPLAGASSPWSWMEGTQQGCGDGTARLETSTWPAARAGSGDAALAPLLRRCPRCPNRPNATLPCHPPPIPTDSAEPESPSQMRGHCPRPQSWQTRRPSRGPEAGMADAGRDGTAAVRDRHAGRTLGCSVQYT